LADAAGLQMNLGDIAQPSLLRPAVRSSGNNVVAQADARRGVAPGEFRFPAAKIEIVIFRPATGSVCNIDRINPFFRAGTGS
jgi:hypothetical protein